MLFAAGNNTPHTLTSASSATWSTDDRLARRPRRPSRRPIPTRPAPTRQLRLPLVRARAAQAQGRSGATCCSPRWRMQLMALATPLFTQAIIDKVVVHQHAEHADRASASRWAIFMRLHRAADAGCASTWCCTPATASTPCSAPRCSSICFKLPLRYFEHRPTGVVAARLHGVETIREFVVRRRGHADARPAVPADLPGA